MRRVLWAAVMGLMSLPTVSLGDDPYSVGHYSVGPGGYVSYSGRCGRDCPYGYSNYCRRGNCGPTGSMPPLGQVWGPKTIVAGAGYCAAGNGWPLDARARPKPAPSRNVVPETVAPPAPAPEKSAPRGVGSAAVKSPWLR